MSIKRAIIVLLLTLPLAGWAQDADSVWVVTNYHKIERMIPMRDGVRLFTSIYIPNDVTADHPLLLTRTPYTCRPYGENNFRAYWNSYHMAYLKEGYIMVVQDVRGRWMSEGQFVDVRPFNANKKGRQIDESSDTFDTIDWLLKNVAHNNGRVGVFGISYPGFYSTMAAASNHPALKAVSPQAPVTNWFIGDDWHHNGAFFAMDAFSFYAGRGFGLPHPKPTMVDPAAFDFPVHDNYRFYLETGSLANLARLAGDDIAFWEDLYNHPDYDDWWKSRDARNATINLQPAMLWVGGLFDAEDHWGAWHSYLAAEQNNPGKPFNKLVMGPWYHGQWSSSDGTHLGNVLFSSNTATWYQQHIEIPFFNYYLKGKGDISGLAEATIFISGANAWRTFSSWPPEGTQPRNLYLNRDGALTWDKPTTDTGMDIYVSDPAHPVPYTEDVHFNRTREYMTDDQRFAERRSDVLTYKTGVLTEDMTVTGDVVAALVTSISTTDADFVVKLIDVFPDSLSYNDVDIYAVRDPECIYPMGGYEMLVHGEIFRGRYRNGFDKPEPFVPGQVAHVKFNVGNVAHTFQRGHRIMVQIQSSWFPLADRNPQKFVDIYHCSDSDFQKSEISIYRNQVNTSTVVLPVLR